MSSMLAPGIAITPQLVGAVPAIELDECCSMLPHRGHGSLTVPLGQLVVGSQGGGRQLRPQGEAGENRLEKHGC